MRPLLTASLVLTALLIGPPSATALPRSCGPLPVELHAHEVHVFVGNTSCRTARRLGRAWVRRGGCNDCRVKAWRCRGAPSETTTVRCKRPGHPRRVVVLDEVIDTAGDVVTTAAAEPPPCRSLDAGGFSVRVAHQGAGCERVGRMVLAWSEARRCVSRTGRPRVCRVSGFSCAPVDGGRLGLHAGADRAAVALCGDAAPARGARAHPPDPDRGLTPPP